MEKKQITVGAKEGLGAGVVAIALLLAFLPMMSQRIADLEFIQSEAFAILAGSVLVLSIFTAIAGLVVIFSKFDDEEEA
jgi:hypothetical protein